VGQAWDRVQRLASLLAVFSFRVNGIRALVEDGRLAQRDDVNVPGKYPSWVGIDVSRPVSLVASGDWQDRTSEHKTVPFSPLSLS
jgi:hypothetical protein